MKTKQGVFSAEIKSTLKSLNATKKLLSLILIGSALTVYAADNVAESATTSKTDAKKSVVIQEDAVVVKITPCEADSPCSAIRDTTTQVMSIVNNNQEATGNVEDKVKGIVVPKFDFRLMTKYALGNNWKLATPKQQDELTSLFQQLLIYTYSSAVSKFKNAKITLISSTSKNLGGKDSKNLSANVISQVLLANNGANAQPVKVEYDLVKVGDKPWLAYDIKIEDASLVTTYRNQFNDVVQSSKIKGLITQLQNKIATLAKGN